MEATETEVLQNAALAIRKANEDVVVVALASANAVAGEPVAVQLKTYRNPVVLDADVVVAETVLDGNTSRETIADDLYTFLRRDVRAKLLAAGIIPPQKGGESVLTNESSNGASNGSSSGGDGSIVSLSGNEWLQVMDDIRQVGSRAKVTVRTVHALRAGDPVALRFEVKDQQSSGSVRPHGSSGLTFAKGDATPLTVLAIDPGTVKCGVAIVESGEPKPRVLHREVIETQRLVARTLQLLADFPHVSPVLVGNATSGKTLFRALQAALPPPIEVQLVEEAFTSQRARARFHLENPPRGLGRLVPPGLRTPPRPYDDYVAQIIAEIIWRQAPPPNPLPEAGRGSLQHNSQTISESLHICNLHIVCLYRLPLPASGRGLGGGAYFRKPANAASIRRVVFAPSSPVTWGSGLPL